MTIRAARLTDRVAFLPGFAKEMGVEDAIFTHITLAACE